MRVQCEFPVLFPQALRLRRKEFSPVPHLTHASVQRKRYGIILWQDFIFIQPMIGNRHAGLILMDIDKQLLMLGVTGIFPVPGHAVAPFCHLKDGIRVVPGRIQSCPDKYAQPVIQRLIVEIHFHLQSLPGPFQNIGNRDGHRKRLCAASGLPVPEFHQVVDFLLQPVIGGNGDFHGHPGLYCGTVGLILRPGKRRSGISAENRRFSHRLKINIFVSDIPGILQHYRFPVNPAAGLMGDIHRPVFIDPAGKPLIFHHIFRGKQ